MLAIRRTGSTEQHTRSLALEERTPQGMEATRTKFSRFAMLGLSSPVARYQHGLIAVSEDDHSPLLRPAGVYFRTLRNWASLRERQPSAAAMQRKVIAPAPCAMETEASAATNKP